MRRSQLIAVTDSLKSSTIVVGVVGAEVKETIAVVAVVVVALGGTVERAEDVAAEVIGGIAVEEKVVDVAVDVDVVDSEVTVGVAMAPNRQVALIPHQFSDWHVVRPIVEHL